MLISGHSSNKKSADTQAIACSEYSQSVLSHFLLISGHSSNKKAVACEHATAFFIFLIVCAYIIPMPPAPPAGIAGVSSLMFATADSVVRSVDATEVAFCNALLVTLTGSRIPLRLLVDA